jgi:hypothetical protein
MLAMMLTGEKRYIKSSTAACAVVRRCILLDLVAGFTYYWRALEPFLKSACLYIFLRNSWNKTLFFMDGYVGNGEISWCIFSQTTPRIIHNSLCYVKIIPLYGLLSVKRKSPDLPQQIPRTVLQGFCQMRGLDAFNSCQRVAISPENDMRYMAERGLCFGIGKTQSQKNACNSRRIPPVG